MNLRKKNLLSFITKSLVVLILVQFHFSNQIFCIEEDGSSSIERSPLSRCVTQKIEPSSEITAQFNQICSLDHQEATRCENCTDISLDREIFISRSDSERATLKVVNPSYFDLYAGNFKPYTSYKIQTVKLLIIDSKFDYHPYQILESTVLII